jgi:hypothetical protein
MEKDVLPRTALRARLFVNEFDGADSAQTARTARDD